MKLALGTVQFGLDYGITNQNGKISDSEASKIIHAASHTNISLFDTANAYGDSEARLGQLTNGYSHCQFISKFSINKKNKINIEQVVQRSLYKLNSPALYGLLFHNEK